MERWINGRGMDRGDGRLWGGDGDYGKVDGEERLVVMVVGGGRRRKWEGGERERREARGGE